MDSIRSAAAQCPGFKRSIPLNRDDESRIEAIEKELIKQGSHVSGHELEIYVKQFVKDSFVPECLSGFSLLSVSFLLSVAARKAE